MPTKSTTHRKQGSLFEEDYLIRTAGQLSTRPDVALTELVANAWDAGATEAAIEIPAEFGTELLVKDDGAGMTADDFRKRWMTLGYNRLSHQGPLADVPTGVDERRRRAFGRNGVGRHGLLCFGDTYDVETRRDGVMQHYRVSTTSGRNPVECQLIGSRPARGHGTTLRVVVTRNLPEPAQVRDVISARFQQDPKFRISVNNEVLNLTDFRGRVQTTEYSACGVTFRLRFINSPLASRRMYHHGVAFWVNNRLVGEPGWHVGKDSLLDGRTNEAKRISVIVESDDLDVHVAHDWSGFRPSEQLERVLSALSDHIREQLSDVLSEHVQERQEEVVREQVDLIRELPVSGQEAVGDFMRHLRETKPTMRQDDMAAAVTAVVELQRTRSGKALLDRFLAMSEADRDALDAILDEWDVQDARVVLEEIDKRLEIVTAIEKLCGDPAADELHMLHPLVTASRWVFGPDCDSPFYAANRSLRNALLQVLRNRIDLDAAEWPSHRPDLLLLRDATLSAFAAEEFDNHASAVIQLRRVVLIELKRGNSTIDRDAMNQASAYVEDILACGHLDGGPFVEAFVVGHRVQPGLQPKRTLGDRQDQAVVNAVTYEQLVRTANARMFRLRDQLASRYAERNPDDVLARVLGEPYQKKLRIAAGLGGE